MRQSLRDCSTCRRPVSPPTVHTLLAAKSGAPAGIRRPYVRLANVPDGLSNTVAIGEKPVAEKEVPVALEDGSETKFTVRAFVLPRKEDFADQALAKEDMIVYNHNSNR